MDVSVHLADLLGEPIARLERIGDNHAWSVFRAETGSARAVFVKARRTPDAHGKGVFAAEAAGLRWLADGHESLVAPVLAVDERMLVLPWLVQSSPTADAADRFGRELAALHAHTPGSYGAPWPGYIAELPLDNSSSTGEWGRWYAERRLAPYLATAAPVLGADGVRLIERVIDRIGDLAGPGEPPARIHGDLWSGNVLWTGDRAVLVDPAAHGGHRETDLAMLALFGVPFLDRILGSYRELVPPASGWRQRIPLHQLHPLLVHVVLFGGSYRGWPWPQRPLRWRSRSSENQLQKGQVAHRRCISYVHDAMRIYACVPKLC
ncbi:fructosamine kinase family protein [Nocardia jejuensis]|uniref:fructosamine kinase family protein n=1 Tax=Nocardia jejuensis TaxID=328049 RepID=UPI000AF9A890|nr:fructosamine kinase family protein [Nocardia jejuensis]